MCLIAAFVNGYSAERQKMATTELFSSPIVLFQCACVCDVHISAPSVWIRDPQPKDIHIDETMIFDHFRATILLDASLYVCMYTNTCMHILMLISHLAWERIAFCSFACMPAGTEIPPYYMVHSMEWHANVSIVLLLNVPDLHTIVQTCFYRR